MHIIVHDYAGHPFQFDLSRELARRGHTVQHLFFGGDKGPKGHTARRADDPPNFSVTPVSIGRPYEKSAFVDRVRNDMNYGTAVGRIIRRDRPDLVISGNTPPDAQNRILSAARSSEAAFVFWMQDFYSRAMRALIGAKWAGLGLAISAWYEREERRQLRASQAVVLISPDFCEPVKQLGVDGDMIHVIPNWGALADIPVCDKDNAWSRAHGLHDSFVYLYSGTLGLKHNPDHLLALADAFLDDPAVAVVVASQGRGRDKLQAGLEERPRPNIILLDLQAMADLPQMLGAADVTVALLERDAGEFSVPSKLLSYYCAGRPLLLSAPLRNAGAKGLAQIGAGAMAAPDDVEGFLGSAQALRYDGAARTRMGAAGRAYAEANFGIDRIASRFEAVFTAVANRAAARKTTA